MALTQQRIESVHCPFEQFRRRSRQERELVSLWFKGVQQLVVATTVRSCGRHFVLKADKPVDTPAVCVEQWQLLSTNTHVSRQTGTQFLSRVVLRCACEASCGHDETSLLPVGPVRKRGHRIANARNHPGYKKYQLLCSWRCHHEHINRQPCQLSSHLRLMGGMTTLPHSYRNMHGRLDCRRKVSFSPFVHPE